MNPTKRNHINPCFWTAFWNPDYYTSYIKDDSQKRHREQKVYSLEFKAPKILFKKVEDIHFIEGLGIAYLNGKELSELNNVNSPRTNQEIDKSSINYEDAFFIDFENHFTELEKIGGYDRIRKVIKTNKIENREDKIYLSCFIITHQIRGFKFLARLFKKYEEGENKKLQSFLHLRSVISNPDLLDSVIRPIVESKWTLYTSREFKFPLSDNPIIYDAGLTWIPLSPKHLLEIDNTKKSKSAIIYKSGINDIKFSRFKKVLIMNTFDSIISHDKNFLEKIRKSNSWQRRKKHLGY